MTEASPGAALAACLAQTLSPNLEPRRAAETQLEAMAMQPGHALLVLQLVSTQGVDGSVVQAAAVHFKNVVKYRWNPPAETSSSNGGLGTSNGGGAGSAAAIALPEQEKEQIRASLLPLLLGSGVAAQAQLAEALTLIAASDFPRRWPSLLPDLVSTFACIETDFGRVGSALVAIDAVLRRLRGEMDSEELRQDLRYVLDTLVKPLLELFKQVGALVRARSSANDVDALVVLFRAVHEVSRIFFSLHQQVIPDIIEDFLADWMQEFHVYLTFETSPAFEAALRRIEPDPERPTAVDDVKASICENLNIYTLKYEEEFEPFVKTFVTDVWSLLVKVGNATSQDGLTAQALRFLTTVARGVHHSLFGDRETLKSIVENIVLPNLRIREEDEELFEMNYTEYIRRDIEGSDSDTRRRMACELVKALVLKFQAPITEMCSSYVNALLQQYAAAPEKEWKLKDCAIFLVMALTVRGKVASRGATSTNELVNIQDFYGAHILPELKSPVDAQPVLKADALKFLTTFRMQLPKAAILEVMPVVVALLGAESNVVHSYAAHAIERILLIREDNRTRRFTTEDVLPFAQDMLKGLFGAFAKPDSSENEYVMKCVVRVLNALGSSGAPVLSVCLAEISKMLVAVCENPRNPTFNHYLFESVAAIMRIGLGGTDKTVIAQLEMSLLGVVDYVISKEVVEFTPYAFQILAQLVEGSPPPLDQTKYLNNFGNWLSPFFWEKPGNVPALVRLLKAYLRKAPEEIVSAGKLEGVLGVFQKLVASKAHDHEGFYILNSIVECMRLDSFRPYIGTVWTLLFRRMQSSRTPKFTRCLCIFVSIFVCVHGVSVVADSIEGVQQGLFAMLVGTIFEAKVLNSINDRLERKMVIVSISRVLCECDYVRPDAPPGLWTTLLKDLLGYVGGDGGSGGGAGDGFDDDENEEPVLYQAAFALLANTSAQEKDPMEAVRDPKQFMAQSLAAYSSRFPGVLLPVLQQLPPNVQETLRQECETAGVGIAS